MRQPYRGWMIVLLMVSTSSMAGEEPAAPVFRPDGSVAEGKTSGGRQTDAGVLVQGNNQFAFDLYAKLAAEKGNLFFSPYSISTALGMTYAGARGETARQMAETLHFRIPEDRLHVAFAGLIADLNKAGTTGGFELAVANALWAQEGYPFLPACIDLVTKSYHAEARTLDFRNETERARVTINEWVEKQTREKIKDLLEPGVLDSLTRLVLTNAIYFKGDWASQFDKEMTRNEPFILAGGEKVEVPMMHQTTEFKYAENEDVQLLELPYAGDRLAMLVILPKARDSLSKVEMKLTGKHLDAWLPRMRMQEVVVALPKFKLILAFRLDKELLELGMSHALNVPPGSADFSGLDGTRDLFISAVVHKAFVDVNEEGTEAAAATGVVFRATAVMPSKPIFRADHPFIFAIRDTKTGSILFMGRVMDPRGEATATQSAPG